MKRIIIFLLAALALAPGWSESNYRLDGITIGQPSSQLRWLDKTNGKFKHVKATVEVKNGEVVTIWGERLLTPTDKTIELGQSGQSALSLLGKPDGDTLYGCGRTSQQIHFYKEAGFDLTVTDGKVTGIRLYKKPVP